MTELPNPSRVEKGIGPIGCLFGVVFWICVFGLIFYGWWTTSR